jgi:hypothetical protein
LGSKARGSRSARRARQPGASSTEASHLLYRSMIAVSNGNRPNLRTRPIMDRKLAIVGILSGVCVSAILAPKDAYFIPNLMFFWLSQLAVLAILWPFSPRPAVVAGVALALATYLGFFYARVFSHRPPDSMAWLGYLFSLPGAAVGSILSALWLRGRLTYGAIAASCIAASLVFAGILINQTIVCTMVMYCGR